MIRKATSKDDQIVRILCKEFLERIKKETGKDYNIQIVNNTIITSMTEQIYPKRIISLYELEEIILKNFPGNFTERDLKSKNRQRELADARSMFCYFANRIFAFTISSIARHLQKHHTSIIHHIRKAEMLAESDYDYATLFKSIKEKLKTSYEEVF
jgi:chromosomal replication initiation ATPase DnaA